MRRGVSLRGVISEETFRAVYSPDGRWLVINPGLAANGDVLLVWLDAQTGAAGKALRVGSYMVIGETFSRDGRRIAVAHRAIRRILVEQARKKKAARHGGQRRREELDPDRLAAPAPDDELLALHEALDRLAERDPEKA